MKLPLQERKEKLIKLIPGNPIIQISKSFATRGKDFFEMAKKMGLEGIMAKKADSIYIPGIRSRQWVKIKIGKRQEVVIGGYTKNDGSPRAFSSLLVGIFKNGHLKYTGKIGAGFSGKMQQEMLARFKPLITKKSPFAEESNINNPFRFRSDLPHASPVWLRPQLVCEVSFTEMTLDGLMRHPAFEGMRVDKNAKDVREEIAEPSARS